MNAPRFLKQKNMLRVLYGLAPVACGGVYFFGWRVAALLAVSLLPGFLTEWFMVSRRNGKVSYACFVTASLYALSLPPTTPFWIAAVGIVVAILFGKEVFGGFGKNVFNPAIVGRAFVYVCFPVELTSRFVPVFRGFPGGLIHWSYRTAMEGSADAVTAATPMWAFRDYGFVTPVKDLFLGTIGTTFDFRGAQTVLSAGSAGEISVVLVLLGGIYLLWTKTAKWQLTLSTLAGALTAAVFFRYGLGADNVPPPLFSLFSGGLVYAAVYMVTDPVSAPKLKLSQWIYGAFIGIMIVFFRFKSIFAGGVGFSILMGNMIAPSLDLWIKRIRERKRASRSSVDTSAAKAGA